MQYIIDIETRDKNKLIAKLRRLKWVIEVQDGGMYHEDHNYSQIWLDANKTESEIDTWLYKYSHCEYIGVTEKT